MKTSNYLKVSLGFLVSAIVILGIVEFLARRKLKDCETRQSFRCPRFTCPESDSQCGSRPYICTDSESTCNIKKCIGYCGKTENNCLD